MKMLLTGAFVLTLICTVYACGKITGHGPRTITAQAVDKTTGQPIPDTRLYVARRSSALLATGVETIESKQSDGQGKAEFTFDFEKGYIYYVYGVKEPGYYNTGNNNTPIYKNKSQNPSVIPVELQPEGYIRFHLKNVNPVGPEDRIHFNNFGSFYGDDVDTIVCCDTRFGNTELLIGYHVRKQGTESSFFQKKIFLPAHDTTLITIEY